MAVIVPVIAQARDAAVSTLGAERFEIEMETGRHMSRDEAVALAIGEAAVADSGTALRDGDREGVLAKREAEVARLIAEGLTNKQIGARLFISERTVDSHVRSILNKFGFNSRSQIAGWVAADR